MKVGDGGAMPRAHESSVSAGILTTAGLATSPEKVAAQGFWSLHARQPVTKRAPHNAFRPAGASRPGAPFPISQERP